MFKYANIVNFGRIFNTFFLNTLLAAVFSHKRLLWFDCYRTDATHNIKLELLFCHLRVSFIIIIFFLFIYLFIYLFLLYTSNNQKRIAKDAPRKDEKRLKARRSNRQWTE